MATLPTPTPEQALTSYYAKFNPEFANDEKVARICASFRKRAAADAPGDWQEQMMAKLTEQRGQDPRDVWAEGQREEAAAAVKAALAGAHEADANGEAEAALAAYAAAGKAALAYVRAYPAHKDDFSYDDLMALSERVRAIKVELGLEVPAPAPAPAPAAAALPTELEEAFATARSADREGNEPNALALYESALKSSLACSRASPELKPLLAEATRSLIARWRELQPAALAAAVAAAPAAAAAALPGVEVVPVVAPQARGSVADLAVAEFCAANGLDLTELQVRHCLCLVFPLHAWLRHCLCLRSCRR